MESVEFNGFRNIVFPPCICTFPILVVCSVPVSVPLVLDCSRSLSVGLAEAHLPLDLVPSLLALFPVAIGAGGSGGGGGMTTGPVDGALLAGGGGG